MSAPLTVIEQISTAMSLGNLRQQVIASNIANRDTQDYQRLRVSFDRAFDETGAARIVADPAATTVPLQQDLIALSTNASRYETLARILNRYFSIADAIAGAGRG